MRTFWVFECVLFIHDPKHLPQCLAHLGAQSVFIALMNEAGVYFTHIVGGGEETEQLGGDLPIGTHHS